MRIASLLLAFICFTALSDLPEFSSPFFVQANGTDLVVDGSVPDPYVADWDGDGVKDLIVGQFSQGKIRLYLNSGTNASPVFTTYSFLQADGSDITMSYG